MHRPAVGVGPEMLAKPLPSVHSDHPPYGFVLAAADRPLLE
jgi:hypothetical protein